MQRAQLHLFAFLGAATALQTLRYTPRLSAILSLITGGFLAVEQVIRLAKIGQRPVGSVLAVIVRPFARKFL